MLVTAAAARLGGRGRWTGACAVMALRYFRRCRRRLCLEAGACAVMGLRCFRPCRRWDDGCRVSRGGCEPKAQERVL